MAIAKTNQKRIPVDVNGQLLDGFKEKLFTQGLLLRPGEEQKYCEAHQMRLTRLENGSTFVGAHRRVADLRRSSINFHVIGGSRFDPENKNGLSHMMEHLLFSRAYTDIAYDQFVDVNAYTSNEKINMVNTGTLNLKVLEFGLPVVLEKTFETLVLPYGFNDRRLKLEKGVIVEEYRDFMADSHNLILIGYRKLLFGKENPINRLAIGNEETINSISLADLTSFYEKHVVPKNIVVSAFSEGVGKELGYLEDKVSRFLESFPREGEREDVDYTKYSIVNDISVDTDHMVPIKHKNEMATVFISWTLDIDLFSEEYFACNVLSDLLNHEIASDVRAEGLGYHAQMYKEDLFPTKIHLAFTFTLSAAHAQKSLGTLTSLVTHAIKRLQDDTTKVHSVLETEKLHQKATPVDATTRLNFAVDGLNKLDAVGDCDAMNSIYLKTEDRHIINLLKRLGNTPPVRVIVGDV